jgi:tetratricopeptide (TPR) repeat protein
MRVDAFDVRTDGVDGRDDIAAMDRLRDAVLSEPGQSETAYKLLKDFCAALVSNRSGANRGELQRELMRNNLALRSTTDDSRRAVTRFPEILQKVVQQYPALLDYAKDFHELIEKQTKRFVGRDHIFERLASFAKRRACGYFCVVADAGLGKTALAAMWAKRSSASAFFANASAGLTRADQCLNHLSVDLIARFDLRHDHLPLRAGEDSAFLSTILAEVANKATRPVWIVVDALDEADPLGAGRNTLLLPNRLPNRVYALLRHRPGNISLTTDADTPTEEWCINSDDNFQLEDIVVYLKKEALRARIRRAQTAANPPIPIDRFVSYLKGKSDGNFKYLDYVLADIAARRPGFDPLDLESLPSGLRGYDQQFWSQMEQVRGKDGWAEWQGLYRPAIAFLAAAREAVPASWLSVMVGRPAEEIEQRALKPWRRFLSQDDRTREDRGRPRRWRVVHQSFVDFLDEGDAVDLHTAHDQIATLYLSAWGGLEAGLPALFDPVRRAELDDYGLRHLAEHLERASRTDDLHRLLSVEWRGSKVETGSVRTVNAWYAAREHVGHTEGYKNDLARAARLAQIADRPNVAPSQYRARIALGLRFALMYTSLNSLARNIPPPLIAALVGKGVWVASQGIAYARVLPPELRVVALIGICSHLDRDEKRTVLREALDTARGIGEDQRRGAALAELAPRLAQVDRVEEALEVARGIDDHEHRAHALAALAPRLMEAGHVEEALEVARGINDEGRRALALYELGRVDEALEVARGIDAEVHRGHVLTELGQVDEALPLARGIDETWYRACALAELVPGLAQAGRMDEALEVAREIDDEGRRARALAELVPRLAQAGRVYQALEVVQEIGDEGSRARALAELGRVYGVLEVAGEIGHDLPRADALKADALNVARGIGHKKSRARAMVEAGFLREALDVTWWINDRRSRAKVIEGLVARVMDVGCLHDALDAAKGIGQEESPGRALVEAGFLQEALELVRRIGDRGDRARAVLVLAPGLARAGPADEEILEARGMEDLTHRARTLAELGRVDEALLAARGIRDECSRARALAGLGCVQEALELARGIVCERDRACALAHVGCADEALEVARGIRDEEDHARALAGLGRVQEALEVARGIDDELSRACALAGLGRVQEALEVARGIKNQRSRSGALKILYRDDEALEVARGIADEEDRARALARLGLLDEALEAARQIDNEERHARAVDDVRQIFDAVERESEYGRYSPWTYALLELARRLAQSGPVDEAMEMAKVIAGEGLKADDDLAELADRLAQAGRMDEGLDVARGIDNEVHRARALAMLAPRLKESGHVKQALEMAHGIDVGQSRAYALATLAPRLAALPLAEALPIWEETLRRSGTRSRHQLMTDLTDLAPAIVAIGGSEAIAQTCQAIEDVGRWWP